jgi:hypothetical protein
LRASLRFMAGHFANDIRGRDCAQRSALFGYARNMRLSVALLALSACGIAFEEGDAGDTSGGGAMSPATSTTIGTTTGSNAGSSTTSAGSGGAAGGDGGGGNVGGEGGSPPLRCPSPNTVCCGSGPCPLPSMECCAVDQNATQQSTCVPAGTCPSSQLEIRCDDSEDCGGMICCSTWTGSQHDKIECAATCTPPGSLGSAGTYPICNYPGGTCPGSLSCFNDCCVGDLGLGYCY